MQKITKLFNGSMIRIIVKDGNVLFSIMDVANALGIEDGRRVVTKALVEEDNDRVFPENWLNSDGKYELTIFVGREHIFALALEADKMVAKRLLKWVVETIIALSGNYEDNEEVNPVDDSIFSITQIAKEFNMSGARLNKLLKELKIIYKVNKQWVLYSQYQDRNFTVSVEIDKGNGEKILHTYWTDAGRRYIHSLLRGLGYTKNKQLELDL